LSSAVLLYVDLMSWAWEHLIVFVMRGWQADGAGVGEAPPPPAAAAEPVLVATSRAARGAAAAPAAKGDAADDRKDNSEVSSFAWASFVASRDS
jgi:hypothetical protein